jgi:GGDEF domain-containing protein
LSSDGQGPETGGQAESRTRTAGLLALLSGLAVLLNALPVPLFYGIHVLLGSVPAIFALLLWRRWWGVGIGVLASLQTWPLWGHPWAVVIFGLELLWLWFWLRRSPPAGDRRSNGQVMLLAIAYWLVIGAPLVFAFYGLVMGIDRANVLVVAVKQSFNGVLNTELAFAALVLTRALQARANRGPGLSLRGVIIGLALLALTLPTLLISITAGQQLQRAVEQGVLDGLKTISLAVARVGPGQQTNQLLIEQLGGDLAYRRIAADGNTASSDPELFQRLDAQFSDGGRSQVSNRDLAILIPRGKGPALKKWVNGYWSYSTQYKGTGGTDLVQVVEPARAAVTRMQDQSSQLLAVSLAVVVLGALLSALVGRLFEREFHRVLPPQLGQPAGFPGGYAPPLGLSAVSELRTLADQLNHRILEANLLYGQLQESNTNLLHSQEELEQRLTTDPLTGCDNSKALMGRLQEEWHRSRRSGEPLSCLCFALDGVDQAYDQFGSGAGDGLLQGVAQALGARLRITDHLFRSADHEFVVIATGCNAGDARQLGGSLLAALAGVWVRPLGDRPSQGPSCDLGHRLDPELHAESRLGIASLDPEQDSAGSLLQRAREGLAPAPAAMATSSGRGASAAEPS